MTRHNGSTDKCTRCHKVYAAGHWIMERREYFVDYNIMICHVCIAAIEQTFIGLELDLAVLAVPRLDEQVVA